MIKQNPQTVDKAFLLSGEFKMVLWIQTIPPPLPPCDFLVNQGPKSADFSGDPSAP